MPQHTHFVSYLFHKKPFKCSNSKSSSKDLFVDTERKEKELLLRFLNINLRRNKAEWYLA